MATAPRMRTTLLTQLLLVAVMFAALTPGCGDVETASPGPAMDAGASSVPPDQTSQGIEDRASVSEAVWRYQMKSLGATEDSVWFLKLERNDPPVELMERFADVAVAPGSQFEARRGVLLSIDSIEFIPEGALVVAASSRSAAGYAYKLRREAGAWRVISGGAIGLR